MESQNTKRPGVPQAGTPEADLRGLRGAQRRERLDYVFSRLQLEGVLEQSVETLSKGFRRRVGLAQAILHDPAVLILDEPTDGLDPNQKHEVRDLIARMARDKAIIISTHILEEVDAVCTRAIVISRGRVVVDGTPDQLAARSRYHNAVSIVLKAGAVPSVEAMIRRLPAVAGTETIDGEDGLACLVAFPQGGQPIIPEISQTAREPANAIEEIRVERGRLDEVFRTVTEGRS